MFNFLLCDVLFYFAVFFICGVMLFVICHFFVLVVVVESKMCESKARVFLFDSFLCLFIYLLF